MDSHHNVGAAAPGLVTPARSDEAAWQGGSEIAVDTKERPDCAAPEACAQQGKPFRTLQAQLALAGWMLTAQADGTFLVSRWGHSRELGDLSAAESFACMVGAR